MGVRVFLDRLEIRKSQLPPQTLEFHVTFKYLKSTFSIGITNESSVVNFDELVDDLFLTVDEKTIQIIHNFKCKLHYTFIYLIPVIFQLNFR